MIEYIEEKLNPDDYIEFLSRTNLGSQTHQGFQGKMRTRNFKEESALAILKKKVL